MADTTPSQDPLRLAEALERMRPEFCGNQATLLEAAALIREQHAALAAPQPNAAADGWISVDDALPSCDGEAVYIGENSSGHIACFNEFDGMSNCFMVTPDENTHVLSDLIAWQRVHRRAPPTLNASKEG